MALERRLNGQGSPFEVSNLRLADTPFRSPQLTLIDIGSRQWLLYWRTSAYAPAHQERRVQGIVQLPLFDLPTEAKAVGSHDVKEAFHSLAFLHLVPKSSDEPDTKK